MKEAHPEVLARHWTEAGETEPAIAEWSRAGKAARARNAFSEARESYRQALALLIHFAGIARTRLPGTAAYERASWSIENYRRLHRA